MVPLEKSTKNHKQKWYHFRKVPKFSNKKGTIRVVKNIENQNMVPFEQSAKKSETKMVPLEKCTENLNLKWYHSRRVPNICDNNGTISENKENFPSPTKIVPFQTTTGNKYFFL